MIKTAGKTAEEIQMSKILLNSAFVGSYADENGNLSREVINFVREDHDRYYVYLSPYGSFTNKCEGVEYVLFVKNCGGNVVEILAKAKVKHDNILSKGIVGAKGEKAKIISQKDIEEYTKKVKEAGITYGGKSLAQIFRLDSENVYDEKVVTMEVEYIKLPKRFSALTTKSTESEDGKIFLLPCDKKLANSSMLCYFDSEKESEKESFDILLKDIIENEELWGEEVKTYAETKKEIEVDDNFFKAILKQDSENVFSNMMFYFFQNYPEMFYEFAKEVLGLDDVKLIDNDSLWITREEKRIDLRVVTDKYFIIIENKIKSGINGIKGEVNGKIESQLSKYYKIASEEIKNEMNHKEIRAFIFCPNYNTIDKKKFVDADKYKVVNYSEIYDFFRKYSKSHEGIRYMSDFVIALKKHTKEADYEKRNDLMLRLKKRIEE